MADAAIALGSNVGDAAGNLDRAVAAIAASPEIRIDAVSPYYRTAPWGVTDQDWFVLERGYQGLTTALAATLPDVRCGAPVRDTHCWKNAPRSRPLTREKMASMSA